MNPPTEIKKGTFVINGLKQLNGWGREKMILEMCANESIV